MNPAHASHAVLGVFSPHLLPVYASAVRELGMEVPLSCSTTPIAHAHTLFYTLTSLSLYASILCISRRRRYSQRALLVHCCGLDELAPVGPTQVVEFCAGGGPPREYTIDPLQWDPPVPRCSIADLGGGGPDENAALLARVLAGGPAADSPVGHALALNAGAAVYVWGGADSVEAGYRRAHALLVAGVGLARLQQWAAVSTALERGGGTVVVGALPTDVVR